jgi:HD-GYP domain-containing protein (c-di-GMP phosphodiesterase class II)
MTTAAAFPTELDLEDDDFYLRALSDMADEREVVAGSAIYTDKGIKLAEKGARIDSRMFDRLVQHKLREPIDKLLSVEGPVDIEALMSTGEDLAQLDLLGSQLADAIGSAERLLAPLRAMPLPASIAFKLTVMRDRRPDLYMHSVRMVLVSVFLALKSGMDEHDCGMVAAAALLHDLGVLHMDPAWSDHNFKAERAQRRHLAAHPITSMLLVRDADCYPEEVAIAVLEHHERMDGSGYPRGLVGAEISPIGCILLLAVVVSAIYEKYRDIPAQRLSLVMRFNHRKFPPALVAHVLPLLREEVARESALVPLGNDASQHIELVNAALLQWDTLKSTLPQVRSMVSGSAFAFADGRLGALRRVLAEAGSHPEQQGELMASSDPLCMAEVALLGREALWQLRNLLNACYGRWPQLDARATQGDAAVANWCEWAMQRL